MWLPHMEEMDGCRIMHARNGLEYRPPELPNYSEDGYCADTKTFYQFPGCFYHGHTRQPFRDVRTIGCDALAQRYESNNVALRTDNTSSMTSQNSMGM